MIVITYSLIIRSWMKGKHAVGSLLQIDAGGIDAEAFAGGLTGTVGEDVSEVGVTACAGDFNATHAECDVLMALGAAFNGLVEAGPAASGIEFGVAHEERVAAGGADVGAIVLGIPVFSAERRLGALLAQDPVLHRVELFLPLGVWFFDLLSFGFVVSHLGLLKCLSIV